ncbi:hypothetical protein [Gallaecimonas mangrovi]|uniref:hypothetical protein n=1 Tax=Gallaecimonas mangrovi TaxID=2291597 RepID=UPI00299F6BBA|nr:hypothetical protein [Gallaecimonas mangrovi]
MLAEVDAFISKPLRHYRQAQWDLEYLQLIYQGQKIEIGLAPGTTIYCQQRQQWLPLAIDFAKSVTVSYQGMSLPVMPITSLITYKQWLAREVDIIDIQELSAITLTKNG